MSISSSDELEGRGFSWDNPSLSDLRMVGKRGFVAAPRRGAIRVSQQGYFSARV